MPALLKEAEEQLRDKESQEFIHSEIPDAINEIAKQDYQKKTPYDPIEVGGNLLAYDALESVNNVFKRIAEAMLAARSRGPPAGWMGTSASGNVPSAQIRTAIASRSARSANV